MLARICEVYHAYGFDPLETSAVETVEALGKFLPDVDRPNEGVFAWQDEDETWLALRYDLTAPLARVFAQHRAALPLPYRAYQVGPVWRNEKPGPGRFRQFYPVRRRHRRLVLGGRRRRDVRDARRGAGGGGDRARRLRGQDQQSQGAERGHGSGRRARSGRSGARRAASWHRDAGDRQARPARRGRCPGAARGRAAGRERGFHRRGRARRRAGGSHPGFHGGAGRRRGGDLRPAARARGRLAGRPRRRAGARGDRRAAGGARRRPG